MIDFLGLKIKDAKMFIGALPGEVLDNPEIQGQIKEMGQALFGTVPATEEGKCPTCRSEIWKFPQPGRAVCPLCNQEAILKYQEGRIKWVYGPAGRRFELPDLEHHYREFLPSKVSEFMARRKELAGRRKSYESKDNWLKTPVNR
jgi:hypothetical protein